MARKASEPKIDAASAEKRHQSFIITHGSTLVASLGPANPHWDGKPLTLKSVLDEWTKPRPDRHPGSQTADNAVWHEGKLVAVIREFASNQFDVLVLDY